MRCLSNKEAPGRCVRLETSQNGKTFLARRWSSVCVCVCLRGFVRLRALLVGPGVLVLSRSLAVLSVQVLWCCLPDLATPVFQRGRRPEDRSTKAATSELPFSGKPLAMKLGSQVVSAGLLVTVRLLYCSLGLPYSQPSLPVVLPPHASCYRVVGGYRPATMQPSKGSGSATLAPLCSVPFSDGSSVVDFSHQSTQLTIASRNYCSHCSHLVASVLPYSQGQPASYDILGGTVELD